MSNVSIIVFLALSSSIFCVCLTLPPLDYGGSERECKYIGCSVGRVANRIRDSTFSLGGETFHVSANKPPHTLHGGKVGFNLANWEVQAVEGDSVTFRHVSPAGDMGYPGTLTATAKYSLAESGEVMVQYGATTDTETIVNLVNHTYFNLAAKVPT